MIHERRLELMMTTQTELEFSISCDIRDVGVGGTQTRSSSLDNSLRVELPAQVFEFFHQKAASHMYVRIVSQT